MAESTIYQFTNSGMVAVTWCQPGTERVAVADSWRVVDGFAVGLTRHLERFRRSVADRAPEAESTVDNFLSTAMSLIPSTGEWFPRVECVETPHGHLFRFYHRHAPERLRTAILATASHDPRTHPRHKGPDLERLMALRKEVAPRGATEAVIITPDGFIAEGAYSSIVVWPPGEAEMWVVDPDIPRIPSVTEASLSAIARQQGVTVVPKKMHPASLHHHTVWVVSALHGIREATSWVGEGPLASGGEFTESWRQLLAASATPVSH